MDLIEPESRQDPQATQATILDSSCRLGDLQMTAKAKKVLFKNNILNLKKDDIIKKEKYIFLHSLAIFLQYQAKHD